MAKMRGGDWNDGMNRVGEKDLGESVWLSWFLAKTLRDFAHVARLRGDDERAAWCDMHRGRLGRAVEAHAWDGDWYHRAYYDDGTPIGSRLADECRIDAIAQSWAVLSGEADPVRARHAVDQSEAMLVRESDGLMLLLTPPFARGARDPGYIKAYPEGIRENGGQYTHAALWTVQALARLGEGDRAMHLLSLINPIHHARDAATIARYRVEPYVVAADVYGAHEHVGRGGWTWYTGSASWMYRIIIEDLLGLSRRGDVITIAPCVPRAWPRFEIDYRVEGGTLHIVVENPEGVSSGVASMHVDGVECPIGEIPLHGTQRVLVVMGRTLRA